MKKKNFTPIFLISLFILSSCTQNNKSILNEYMNAHNSHNIQKPLAYYSDDITFQLVGTWTKNGKEEIAELEEWDSAVNSKLQFYVQKESGDTLFCYGTETNDWFTAIGINEIKYDLIIFIFDNQVITKIIAKLDPEINERIGRAMGSIIEYTTQTNNDILSELIPKGEFIYSQESAKKWLKLLGEWNKERTDKVAK